MDATANLELPFLASHQTQKHVTLNESLRRLDLITHLVVQDHLPEPPTDGLQDGALYILDTSPGSGAWTGGVAGDLFGFADGAWLRLRPKPGWRCFLLSQGSEWRYDGTDWQLVGAPDSAQQFGINTSADGYNRFAVKTDGVLISHDDVTPGSGSVRVAVNRDNISDTAAIMFQTAYQSRAELGLVGDGRLSVRTSVDGDEFDTALSVDPVSRSLELGIGQKLDFATRTPAGDWAYSILGVSSNFVFRKPSSDDSLSTGSMFVFENVGGQITGNPFWQGLQLASTPVREAGAFRYPRMSLFWSYTDKDDPSDLFFNVRAANTGGIATNMAFEAVQGGSIYLSGSSIIAGNKTVPGGARLCVDGALRLKVYPEGTLPDASSLGEGAIAVERLATGAVVLRVSDGAGWS